MDNELKLCPFCGKPAIDNFIDDGGDYPSRHVGCDYCLIYAIDDTEWNTRPLEDALRAELEQARAELAAMRERERFIPISERLPKKDGEYLVLNLSPWKQIAFYKADLEVWSVHGVIAWRELPAPEEP